MSEADLQQFRDAVLADRSLQQALLAAPERSVFTDLVVDLAARRGWSVTGDEVQSALQAARRSWLERWV